MERMRRWLSLALVLVLALSVMAVTAFAAGETVTVCFVPSKDWKQDNVWFAAYCWNDSGSQWVKLEQDGFCYTGEIPVEYTNIIFARMASNQTEMNWDNRWTQTGDLVLDASNPCFVKGSGWEGSGGTWTTCPPAFDYYLAGYLNGSDVGINNSQNKAEYLFTNGYLDVTFTQDSYLCMSVQYDGVVIGNLMTASYVSSGDSALMQITGSEKFRVSAGTYRLVMTRHEDDSVTLGFGCLHDKTHHDGVEATCTDDGTVEYWSCDICGKNYADQYGVTELTELTIPAKNHNYSDNGFCTNVNGGVLCDAYEPAVLVTNENYAELGLTADYVGYYAITNAGNLYWFAEKVDNENATYGTAKAVLTKDITVNSGTVTAESTGLREWNPVGSANAGYDGIFDGSGKTVSGLYCVSQKPVTGDPFINDNIGLIGHLTSRGVVKNVTVANSYLYGSMSIGGIVGYNSGTVTNCRNEATVVGLAHVGGVAGYNYYGTVKLCGNNGTIEASGDNAGGIVGTSGSVSDCWNTGDVRARSGIAGGIVGQLSAGKAENSWSTGNVSGTTCGGIVGHIQGGVMVRNCYSTMTSQVGQDNTDYGITNVDSKTLDQFASGEVAYLLRTRAVGTNVWGQDLDNGKPKQDVPTFTGADVYQVVVDCAGNLGYSNTNADKAVHNYDDNGFCINPVGDGVLCDAYEPAVLVTNENYAELGLTADYVGYYAITNAGNLYWFAEKVDNENDTYKSANVVLTKDITVNSGTVTAESTGLREWNPIGHYSRQEVDNTTVYDDRRFSGIFDGNGKTVSGLYFNDENASFVGLFAGITGNALVKDVTLSNSYICGNTEVGGIAGYCSGGTITGCVNNAAIHGDDDIGGIVGSNYGSVENCENIAPITANGSVGGITSENMSAPLRNCVNSGTVTSINGSASGITVDCGLGVAVVELCGNSGTVTGSTSAAGIVSACDRNIRNCWNTGSIISDSKAGGIAGYIGDFFYEITLENCWSTGTVFSEDGITMGGIVGDTTPRADIVVKNCYSSMIPMGNNNDSYGKTPAITHVEQKTLEQFTSGEVAYLLRTRAVGTNVWGQDLDNGKTVQTVPTFSGADVYQVVVDCAGNLGYSNTNADKAVHNYDDNGFCINPVGDGVCDAYEPAIPVTNENYAELGLTADYVGYYAITNAGNLYWFAEKVDNENDTYGAANVVLTKDITVNPGTVTAESTGLREWNPIGYCFRGIRNGTYVMDIRSFDGVFDGNGKTVSGLYFNDENAECVGLIAYTRQAALVKNVTLSNSYLRGGKYVGGIVGENAGDIIGCVNNAVICGTDDVGGIAGLHHPRKAMEQCGNTGTIVGSHESAGGIMGANYGNVRSCWNTGDVSAPCRTGGIAGSMSTGGTKSYVENCWSTGTVTGEDGNTVGGITGHVYSGVTIQNSYSVMEPIGETGEGNITITNTERKTLDQFTSGEVAYLLRTRAEEGTNVWGQDLDNGKEVQTVPTFTGADVYYGQVPCERQSYTNNPDCTDVIHHNWKYTADGASITGECLNGCGTDGGKVTLVLDGSTVYDGAEKVVVAEGALTGIATLPAVTYEGDRVNIGTFTAKLTLEDGTEAKLDVTITAKELTPTIEGVEDSYEYTGEAIKPEITVKDGDKVLVEGTDYDVTYGENTNVGEGTVTVTMKGSYEGEAKETFDITPKAITPTIEGVKDSYTYTGEAIKPEITVKDGDKVLVEGTDYDVTYGDNKNVGEGTVTVTLKGSYEGEAEKTFDITPKSITPTIEGVKDSYTYTGEAIKPEITVKDGDKVLVEGTDYDVTYGDNKNVGEGTVTVTMKGNYSGSAEETFTITARVVIPGTDSPNTGDTANVVLWSSIALISLAAAAALVLGKKRFSV